MSLFHISNIPFVRGNNLEASANKNSFQIFFLDVENCTLFFAKLVRLISIYLRRHSFKKFLWQVLHLFPAYLALNINSNYSRTHQYSF